MDILCSEDERILDQRAIHDFGIPSLQLMKQAAEQVKKRIDEMNVEHKRILIICGPGNNGGDGFALALLLKEAWYEQVEILCDVPFEKMSLDERSYAKLAEKANIPIYANMSLIEKQELLRQQDLLVDALFGSGLSRELKDGYAQLIDLMNASFAYILSIDIPSGIHSDTGEIMGNAVCADETITFACLKKGLLIHHGSRCAGKLHVSDIGIPIDAYEGLDTIHVLDDEVVRKFLPKRRAHSHKGSYGKVLLVGGSVSMHGALTLVSKSMLRSGVGTLTLFLPHDIVPILSMKMEECMLIDAPSKNGFFAMEAIELLKERIHEYDLVVIGNGMGRGAVSDELVRIVLESELPCVLDGDGIFSCANHMELLKQHKNTCILTPHPKEMNYLSGLSVSEICADPFTVTDTFIKEYPNTVLVLKDQYTIIRSVNGCYMNMAGNHALAKGGSGDVLCGIIAGLFAQGKAALENAAAGVYVHARSGDKLIESEDANSILPSDLIPILSSIYKRLRTKE